MDGGNKFGIVIRTQLLHNPNYQFTYRAQVDSQTKCKFFTNTVSCMEYEEWEATTVTCNWTNDASLQCSWKPKC
ncbi:MAG: hypothetical protein ACI9VX_001465 [Dinoroseobacter sp.]|jgi:hypothetical protein